MADQEDGIETEVLADEVIVSAESEGVSATDGGGVDGVKGSDVSIEGLDINTPLVETGSMEVIRGVEQSETTVDTTMRLGPSGSDYVLVDPKIGGVSVGVEIHESIISASKDVDKGSDLGSVVLKSIGVSVGLEVHGTPKPKGVETGLDLCLVESVTNGVSVGVEIQESLISASKDVDKRSDLDSDLGSAEPERKGVSVSGVDVQGSLTSTPKNVDTELGLVLVESEKNGVSTGADIQESLISASKVIVTDPYIGLVEPESIGVSVDVDVHESNIDMEVHESLIGTSKDIESKHDFGLVEPENNGVSVGADVHPPLMDSENEIDTNNGDTAKPRTETVHVDSDAEIEEETETHDTVEEETESHDTVEEETESHDTVDGIEEHDFSVGDIIWGKVKSHPWWPGQIYDSANASNEAMKYKPKNRLLVAYYGDSTFAWCLPSQLVPFVENFDTMSKQNGTKKFVNAVTEAVDEINRLVDISMTCPCVPESNRKELTKTPVVNAGISPGVIAPEGDMGKQLSFRYNPSELLASVAITAKTVSFSSVLELSILKGWLSSFYRSKGGFSLAHYHDPILVKGLEDKSKIGNIGAAKVSVRGPVEEQCTRKHRSVAELISSCMDTTPKNRNSANKKRKGNEEHGTCSNMNQDCSTRKKRGRKDMEYDVGSEEKLPESSKPRKSLKVDIPVENNDGKHVEEKFSPRERRKSKYLSLPYTSPPSRVGYPSYKGEEKESERITRIARVGERMTKAAVQLLDSTPLKSNDESEKKQAPIVYSREKTVQSEPLIAKTAMKDENSITNAKVDEVLSGLKSLATGPVSSLNTNMLEMTKAFESEFRSSIYSDGTNYKTYQKRVNDSIQTSKKRERDITEKLKNKLENTTSKPKRQQARCSSTKKNNNNNNNDDLEVPLASSIVLTFDSDFNLPLKGDIIERFSDFGDVNEDETEVFLESCSVKIVYMNKGCVEEALKASLCGKPFFSGIVDYKLCYRQKV